jgi:steroid 5-alpha reductase family enzyme
MNLVYSVLFSNVFHLMLLSVGGFVIVGYGISRLLRRNDIADGLWGTGFIVIALVEGGTNFFALSILSKLVVGLTILWGLRLSVYLWVRLLGKAEDKRYANWRKQWGNKEPIRSFLQIFLLQGLLMGLISTPIVWVLSAGETAIGPSAVFGSCVFLLGFAIETAADGQLSEFKRDRRNNGKLMTQGLWGIVRHPNYLGEILVWWGMFFIALNVPGGGVTVISPVLNHFLISESIWHSDAGRALAGKRRKF